MPIPIWEWSDSEFPSGVGFLYRRPQVIIQVKTVIGKLVERRGTTYLWKTFLMVQNVFHAVLPVLSKIVFVLFFLSSVHVPEQLCPILEDCSMRYNLHLFDTFGYTISFDTPIWCGLHWYVQIFTVINISRHINVYQHICKEYTYYRII